MKSLARDRPRVPIASSTSLVDRDPSDPLHRVVELAQRGRIILDVTEADHRAATETLGPAHPVTAHFQAQKAEALKAWDRLVMELGREILEEAVAQPPVAWLEAPARRSRPAGRFFPIDGRTYLAEPVPGTSAAPVQWRLVRLDSQVDPYYVCRLDTSGHQCDCAEWIYRVAQPIAGVAAPRHCKHLLALIALGWI
ncbi:MAG: hypothetical protein SFX72_16415 [Isosphaeraceae bacterium]|nr:hypothetical protein [Isosphaeraceae bacterium]